MNDRLCGTRTLDDMSVAFNVVKIVYYDPLPTIDTRFAMQWVVGERAMIYAMNILLNATMGSRKI